MEQTIMTVKEAAAYIRVSPSKMYQLVRENAVPHITLGHRCIIPKEQLVIWIGKSVRGGAV